MSYDVRYGIDPAKLEPGRIHVWRYAKYDSPTYNLSKMFRSAMEWNYKQGEWYPIDEALKHIIIGINNLYRDPDKYRAMEPENKWGTYEDAIKALTSWRDEIYELLENKPAEAL